MVNKSHVTVVPINSPTLNRWEMQQVGTTAAVAPAPAPAPEKDKTSVTNSDAKMSSINVTALDGIVSVNSLFTMTIFIGFSMTVPENATAVSTAACTTSRETVRRLIVIEVVCFSFFLFSSLIAQSLKLAVNLRNNMDPKDSHKGEINAHYVKCGLFTSAVGSVLGCIFLMMSIVDLIRVKLGSFSCGGKPIYAVVVLCIFVGSGLLVYIITATYVTFSVQEIVDTHKDEEEKAAKAAAAAAAAAVAAAAAQPNQN